MSEQMGGGDIAELVQQMEQSEDDPRRCYALVKQRISEYRQSGNTSAGRFGPHGTDAHGRVHAAVAGPLRFCWRNLWAPNIRAVAPEFDRLRVFPNVLFFHASFFSTLVSRRLNLPRRPISPAVLVPSRWIPGINPGKTGSRTSRFYFGTNQARGSRHERTLPQKADLEGEEDHGLKKCLSASI